MHSEIIIRINKVIDYIEEHLDEEHQLEKLAQIAQLSKFHFHKTFKIITQETPHDYLNRKRIEKIASFLIHNSDKSISYLSSKYGFQNLSSFSRSFKKYYGFSASELKHKAKNQIITATSKNSKIGKTTLMSEDYFYKIEKTKKWMTTKAEISVKHMPEINLYYVRHWGNPHTIHQAFDKLLVACRRVDYHPKKKNFFTLFHDNPNITVDYKIRQSACIEINQPGKLQSALPRLSIPPQKYVVGKFLLTDKEFELAWNSLIIWMNENNIRANDGYRFEMFLNNSLFDNTQNYQVEIGIPII